MASSDSALPSRRPFLMPVGVAKPSPILARKASVIEEWSNLQRTRAHSKSESDKKNALSSIATSVATPPIGSSPSATPPRHSLSGSTPAQGDAAGSGVSPGGNPHQNGMETATGGGMGIEEAQKFLSARYSESENITL